MPSNYIRYQKIASNRKLKRAPATNIGYSNVSTVFMMVFETDNGISFAINCSMVTNGKRSIIPVEKYKLRISTRKDGSKYFNFYKSDKQVRITDPFRLIRHFQVDTGKTIKATDWGIGDPTFSTRHDYNKKIKTYGLSKTSTLKLYRFIKKFCQRHKVSIKYLSKNPLCLIKQLCYPGLSNIEDKYVSKIITNKDFKKPLHRILCTNGSKTKRLINNIITTEPVNLFHKLMYAKLIRQIYGLDKAQDFLENNDINAVYFASKKDIFNIIKFLKKNFSHLSYPKMVAAIQSSTHTITDLQRMMMDVETLPEYDSVEDLHNKLALEHRRRAQKPLMEAIIPEYDQITKMVAEWNDDKFSVVLPKVGAELVSWSTQMSNCVSTYISRIVDKKYYIFAIYENNQLKYNVGLNVNPCGDKWSFSIQQWSGRFNRSIPEEDSTRLIELLRKYVDISDYIL